MFTRVLIIDKDDVLANFGLGEVFFKRNQFEEAVAYLEKVLSLNSNHSLAYLVLGKAYEGLGLVKEACNIYSRGVEVASKRVK